MPAELLYLLPVLAVAVFGYFIMMFYQKRSDANMKSRVEADMKSAPAAATGSRHAVSRGFADPSERRITDIEQKIGTLTHALADQQQVIDRFQNENTTYVNEISDLKKRLHGLQKEYDLILSENFSLKAKVKKITASQPAVPPGPMTNGTAHYNALPPDMEKMNKYERAELQKRLFDDTRLMKAINPDDTSEIDIDDLK